MPRKAADKPEKPSLKVVPPATVCKDPLGRAEQFEREVSDELCERSGLEKLGPVVRAVVKLAALQFCSANELFEQGLMSGDRQLLSAASTVGGAARLNLVSAHNLALGQGKAVREAEEDDGSREFYQPGKSA
jgi:hypothetical protein